MAASDGAGCGVTSPLCDASPDPPSTKLENPGVVAVALLCVASTVVESVDQLVPPVGNLNIDNEPYVVRAECGNDSVIVPLFAAFDVTVKKLPIPVTPGSVNAVGLELDDVTVKLEAAPETFTENELTVTVCPSDTGPE
jgi:hypothetical protein